MHTSVVELEQRRNDFGGGGRAPPGRSCRTDLGTTTRGRRWECCSAGGILIPARGCARRRDAVVHRNPSSPSRFTREPTAAGGVGGDATAVPQAAGRRPRFFFPKGRAPRSASRANADPQPRTVGVGLRPLSSWPPYAEVGPQRSDCSVNLSPYRRTRVR